MKRMRTWLMNLNPFRKKDYTIGSDDYNRMLAANEARTEESGINNSRWAPGALRRLKNKERWGNMKSSLRSWWHN